MQLAADDAGVDLDEALCCYQRAVELDPTSEEGWTGIGYFLDVIRDDRPGAEKAFGRAVAVGGSADSFAGLARILAEQGRGEEALSLLTPSYCPCFDDVKIQKIKRQIKAGDWSPIV